MQGGAQGLGERRNGIGGGSPGRPPGMVTVILRLGNRVKRKCYKHGVGTGVLVRCWRSGRGGGGGSDRVNDMNGGIQEDGGGWRVEGPEGDSLVGQREVGGGGAGRGGGLHNLKDRRRSLLYVLKPSR